MFMIEYFVILQRHRGSRFPDVCIFRDEDRETAIREMWKYRKKHGFTLEENDGRRSTIADILLVEREPVTGGKTISTTPYCHLFNSFDDRRPEEETRKLQEIYKKEEAK